MNRLTKKRTARLRTGIQLGFFGLVALIVTNHALDGALPLLANANLHAVCPFGGVVSVYQFATTGTLVRKIHESSMVLGGIVIVTALFVGPAFCGWICPFGSLQEWIGRIGKKFTGGRFNRFIPARLDSYLRHLRYAVLIWVIYVTARSGELIFEAYDPYYALFNFWSGEVAITGFIALGLVVLASLFVERPFCKYACPYGAFLGIFNLFRVFGIRRNADTCINCKACDRTCPMIIPVSTAGTVRHHQCISCLKCTSEQACPVAQTVELRVGRFEEVKV